MHSVEPNQIYCVLIPYKDVFLETLKEYEYLINTAKERYVYTLDQKKYCIRHGLLNKYLGLLLNCEPASIKFNSNQYGKPGIAKVHECTLQFSLSSSEDYAVFVISYAETGVDIEFKDSDFDWQVLAATYFHANEIKNIQNINQYYSIWTKKEALLKYWGLGLNKEMDSFNVLEPEPLFVTSCEIIDNYCLSIASSLDAPNIIFEQYADSEFRDFCLIPPV